MDFPADFLFGVATSAYQIEGAVHADGRGESIWDRFCAQTGAVEDGSSGEPACDHYHRFVEDLDLLAALGVNAYRFSVAWPRILPDGGGAVNQAGLDFYRRLLEGLRDRGIEPLPTLYHWDLPQALEDRGGWLDRDTAARFAEYAAVVADSLGDLVPAWLTQNEPWCAAFLATARARRRRESVTGRRPSARRTICCSPTALPSTPCERMRRRPPSASPSTSTPSRRRAAPRRISRPPGSRTASRTAGSWIPSSSAGIPPTCGTPSRRTSGPGTTRYRVTRSRSVDRSTSSASTSIPATGCARRPSPSRSASTRYRRRGEPTAMGWEVAPDRLRELLLRLRADYGPIPIRVTENGAAYEDLLVDGAVDDVERLEFVRRHLEVLSRAIARRHRRARLLPLVAARQLRVGAGLRQAVRHRPRRPHDTAPDSEALRSLVPRLHCRERGPSSVASAPCRS